jgi:hypothetical protein
MSSFNQATNNLIKESLISFHSKEGGYQLYPRTRNSPNKPEELQPEEEEDLHFGVFELEMVETPMSKQEQDINSTNDMSGSMSDLCPDGRTKMQHLQLTLENITRLLSANAEQIEVNLEITGFDDSIVQVLESTKITSEPEQLQQIINSMKTKLYSRGSTNIQLALQDATTRLEQKPTKSQKSFIFMTDGIITSGSTNIKTLLQSVPKDCQNYFIGFGADHDFALLQQLASINNGSYYYVDKIENAGLVFGEIIHSILYTALRKITIKVTNGEIYNFQTNQWLTEIRVPNLCGEAKKTFHVRSQNPNEFQLTLTGTGEQGDYKYEECALPPLQDIKTNTIEPVDLTKFMYRQKVLEVLYETTIIAKSRNTTENFRMGWSFALNSLRKQIEDFRSGDQVSEEDKHYLKQLTDDLYISENTLHSEKALLYSTVRQNAQGRGTSYNVTQVDNSCLRRQHLAFLDDNYNVELNPISRAYTSNTQAQVMRSCSQNPNPHPEEDDYNGSQYVAPEAGAEAGAETDPDILEIMRLQKEEDARLARTNTNTLKRSTGYYCDDEEEVQGWTKIQRS